MSETHKSANELAVERTDMALSRTVMALERTLMAWVRTAVSLISFGFTIFKFLEAMNQEGKVLKEHSARNLGLFLITLGISLLFLGIFQYKREVKRFKGMTTEKIPLSLALIAAGGVILVGIFTVLNIFFGFGGF